MYDIKLDVFSVSSRPCRLPQEQIIDYYDDGRPQFQWEYLRQLYILQGYEDILNYCDSCPLNVFGGLEGCSGPVEGLDIFVRALGELIPDSPWADIPLDGTPVTPEQMDELYLALGSLQDKLSLQQWPVAQPKLHGDPMKEYFPDGSWRLQFYPWNGEGPPGLIAHNPGYQVYLSRHGLVVKPTYDDPVPHVFRKLWREAKGTFGLSTTGETIGFEMSMARYPTWGFESVPGAEIVFEMKPASEVFQEILMVLDVFCNLARDYDCVILFREH